MKPDEPAAEQQGKGRSDPATLALVILAVLAIGAVITYLGPILKPFLVAVFLYYMTSAAAVPWIRRGWPRWLVYLALAVAVIVIAATLALFVYSQARTFPDTWTTTYQPRIRALLRRETPAELGRSLEEIFNVSSREILTFAFENSVGVIEMLSLAFFYLLFMILGSHKMAGRILRAFPGPQGERVLIIGRKISTGMEQFIRVKTLVSAGMGLSTAVLLYLFGVDYWLLCGFLFFALNYITYIGSIAACIPPIVLAFLGLDSMVTATAAAVLVVVNRFVWIDFVEIKLSGKQLNIDSVLLFLWLAYWGWTWGVLGLILAFPMVTALKIVMENLESTRGWAILMGED